MPARYIGVEKRLMINLRIDPLTGCWNWTKATDRDGYGSIKIKKKTCRVSRVAYQLYVGQIPDNLLVLHICDNRRCFNPNHLELGDEGKNRRDAFKRGRITADDLKHWFKKRSEKHRKTHCNRGHEFSPENTRVKKNGSRSCRKCDKLWRLNKRKEPKNDEGTSSIF